MVRAQWYADKEFHRATLLSIEPGEVYRVEFYAPDHSQSEEKLECVVQRSGIQYMFGLPTDRPVFLTDAERVEYNNDMDTVEISAKVLAKRADEHGEGAWLPAIIKEKDYETTNINVMFMKDETHALVLRSEIQLLYSDSPMKLDKKGSPFYPYDILPPAGPHYNHKGAGGYLSRRVGFDDNGHKKHRANATFNNITQMKQTAEKPNLKGIKSIRAQHRDFNGTLTIVAGNSTILATWSNGCEDDIVVKLDNTKIVWWQSRDNIGVWVEFETRNYHNYRFAMTPESRPIVLNMCRIMNERIREGRTEVSHFMEDEEERSIDHANEDSISPEDLEGYSDEEGSHTVCEATNTSNIPENDGIDELSGSDSEDGGLDGEGDAEGPEVDKIGSKPAIGNGDGGEVTNLTGPSDEEEEVSLNAIAVGEAAVTGHQECIGNVKDGENEESA